MHKENGRSEPADNKECSKLRDNKGFLCSQCGKHIKITRSEFGKSYYCNACGSRLIEED